MRLESHALFPFRRPDLLQRKGNNACDSSLIVQGTVARSPSILANHGRNGIADDRQGTGRLPRHLGRREIGAVGTRRRAHSSDEGRRSLAGGGGGGRGGGFV